MSPRTVWAAGWPGHPGTYIGLASDAYLAGGWCYSEHRGRRTGVARQTVLEVVDADSTSLLVAAAWGERSDWFQNVQADPSVAISSGRCRGVSATAKVLDKSDAIRVFERYGANHKTAARGLAKAFHLPFGDAAAMADLVPVVRLSFDQPL